MNFLAPGQKWQIFECLAKDFMVIPPGYNNLQIM